MSEEEVLTDNEDLKKPATEEAETPADFLTDLGNTLLERKGIDVDLACILTKHLLTSTPTTQAVMNAKQAIQELVNERAKLEASGG